jgi:hypothetical protein
MSRRLGASPKAAGESPLFRTRFPAPAGQEVPGPQSTTEAIDRPVAMAMPVKPLIQRRILLAWRMHSLGIG